MIQAQREAIEKMRNNGYGYERIANRIGISLNTVKSYCRRNNLAGKKSVNGMVRFVQTGDGTSVCMNCGIPVEQAPGRKQKKFCSDQCRMRWWNNHLDKVNRKANYEFICPHCKKPFTVYGNANRKYCCHECYIEDRFGGVR